MLISVNNRENLAKDTQKNQKFPILISPDFHPSARKLASLMYICKS
jgi:hypothetical protein